MVLPPPPGKILLVHRMGGEKTRKNHVVVSLKKTQSRVDNDVGFRMHVPRKEVACSTNAFRGLIMTDESLWFALTRQVTRKRGYVSADVPGWRKSSMRSWAMWNIRFLNGLFSRAIFFRPTTQFIVLLFFFF